MTSARFSYVLIRLAASFALCLCTIAFAGLANSLLADEWLTYRHDQRRSGVSEETISATNMQLAWRWRSKLPPAPAWPDSARWDAYAKVSGLRSMRDYDSAFHPVASESNVYFGSNADDTLRCLDLRSGKVVWKFTTGAPIRVPPTLYDGQVFFGCDDGKVYALNSQTGNLRWQIELKPDSSYFVNDGRLCSMQPVRTGVLIDDQREVAIAGCGIFPWKSTSLFGLNLKSGEIVWHQELGEGWTLEGAMLLSDRSIIAPQGRSPPQLFSRESGQPQGAVAGGGGSFVLLTEEQKLLHGPGNKGGWITESSTQDRHKLATFEGGSSVVVIKDTAYLLSPEELTCIDRKTQQEVWRIRLERPQEVIASQGTLWIGGDHYVAAIDAGSGKLLWASEVTGRAIGLGISSGRLIVSTDQGYVACYVSKSHFSSAKAEEIEIADPELSESLAAFVGHAPLPVRPRETASPTEAVSEAAQTDEVAGTSEEAPEATEAATPKPTDPKPPQDGGLNLETGPEIRFVQTGVAEIRWTTTEPTECKIELVLGRAKVERPEDIPASTKEHKGFLSGIQRNELIEFRIRTPDGRTSRLFECDGHFDYSRPQENPALVESGIEIQSAATKLVAKLALKQPYGMCVISSPLDHLLTPTDFAAASHYDVISVVSDSDKCSRLRSQQVGAGLYGRPLSIYPSDQIHRFPIGFANFVYYWPTDEDKVADDIGNKSQRLCRLLKPGGLFIAPSQESISKSLLSEGLKVTREISIENEAYNLWRRPRSNGAAGWTHMYGNPDNTAFAGESLNEADSIDDLEIAWCGRPGPRYQSDRGNRKPSPLASGGRLYLQGLYRLIGMDAHNGTILWSHELPEVVRFNVPRDCANWCADDESLYVALQGRCKVIDGATGDFVRELTVWNPTDRNMNWGFVARQGELLIGSCVQSDAQFTEFWGGEFWYDAKDGELAKKVCSDALFAQNPAEDQLTWTYHGGLVVNPTVCVNDDQIVFIECRSEKLKLDQTRRLDGDEFWQNLYIVSLNTKTGEKQWETAAKPLAGVSAFYGVMAADRYLIQSSNDGDFALYAIGLSDGKMLWRGKYKWEANHHGKHLSRPAVVDDRIYLRPFTIALDSGKVLADQFPAGHQCGTYTASKNALFLRAGSLAMWDGKSTAATRFNRVRPDCWISTIPAEGMLLSPEGGGGCSCGGWIETSMGFAPK